MYYPQLFVGFVVSSITVVGILLLKRIFRSQLTALWHYKLWFLLPIALTLPMLPLDKLRLGFEWSLPKVARSSGNGAPNMGPAGPAAGDGSWLQDFTVSVGRTSSAFLDGAVIGIWVAGMLALAVPVLRSWLKIKELKRTSRQVNDEETLRLLEQCKQHLGLSKRFVVLESADVVSPMLIGVGRTYLVFPQRFCEWLSAEEIKYIILHELIHYKHKDHLTSVLLVAYQLLYWYNPLVWIAFRIMRSDREIACDHAVLRTLDDRSYAKYGHTIINFAEKLSRPAAPAWVNRFASSKKQLKRRIERIASYTSESRRLRRKSIAVFLVAAAFVACQVPLVSALAVDENRFSFTDERAAYEDLGAYFGGYDGSFVMYHAQEDRYTIYNKSGSERRVSPDSTYKIYGALFGLDSGAVGTNESTLRWNGERQPYDEWNRDQDLFTAMKRSVNWYFQELDARIGRDRLQAYLDRVGYGNADLSDGAAPFWLEASLKISPVEQVLLLESFYSNRFGFRDEHIETVKDAIRLDEKEGALLSGKTGTGAANGKEERGWFVGYVEKEGDTYFFATHIGSENRANGSAAAEIALSILRDKGIY
ncbi:BlaR1 family beta-lactam sensor/signal transducer [Paenibacillus antri]|uniref:BlaR1 family beta-lactam sensor/signal transducer n=1 Tax=Paenibacillus antri TaxID=2582848 RepID=UPI001EE4259B|nr:BlaR1 family beta-lactam sensor/signal transducer [Paenibacillus antri]